MTTRSAPNQASWSVSPRASPSAEPSASPMKAAAGRSNLSPPRCKSNSRHPTGACASRSWPVTTLPIHPPIPSTARPPARPRHRPHRRRPPPPPSSHPLPPTTGPSIPIPSPADQNSARMPHPAPTPPPQVENSGTPSTRHQPLLRHPPQEKASPLPKNRLHRLLLRPLPHPRPLPRPIRMMAFTAITKTMPSLE